jgi:hypothetical protein
MPTQLPALACCRTTSNLGDCFLLNAGEVVRHEISALGYVAAPITQENVFIFRLHARRDERPIEGVEFAG